MVYFVITINQSLGSRNPLPSLIVTGIFLKYYVDLGSIEEMTKASANNSKPNKNVKSSRSQEVGSQSFSSWLRTIAKKSVNTVVKILSDAFYIPPPPLQLIFSKEIRPDEQSLTLPSPDISVNNTFGENHQQASNGFENSSPAIIVEPPAPIEHISSQAKNDPENIIETVRLIQSLMIIVTYPHNPIW